MSEKLKEYWENNVRANYKKISAVIASIITTSTTIWLYVWKSNLELSVGWFMWLMAINGYVTMIVNLIFKGEAENERTKRRMLQKDLEHTRDTSELKVMLAAREDRILDAVEACDNWDEANELIQKYRKLMRRRDERQKTLSDE